MYDEEDDMEVDWEDDVISNFSEKEYAVIDKGYESEKRVTIIEIGTMEVLVRDNHNQEYPVNILRLSKF